MYGYCYITYSLQVYNKIPIQSVCTVIRSCHKFISPENIIIHSVSSDDFLHVRLEAVEQQMWNYSSYVYEKK